MLSDTIITKIPTTVGGRVFALGWLIPGTNWAENPELFLHIVVQEMIKLNFIGEGELKFVLAPSNLMHTPILKATIG